MESKKQYMKARRCLMRGKDRPRKKEEKHQEIEREKKKGGKRSKEESKGEKCQAVIATQTRLQLKWEDIAQNMYL